MDTGRYKLAYSSSFIGFDARIVYRQTSDDTGCDVRNRLRVPFRVFRDFVVKNSFLVSKDKYFFRDFRVLVVKIKQ